MTINKNLVLAVLTTLAGLAYLFLAAYVGYNYIPAAPDGNGNPMHGLSAFFGIVIAVASIFAVVILNNYFNDREVRIKERQAKIAREVQRGY